MVEQVVKDAVMMGQLKIFSGLLALIIIVKFLLHVVLPGCYFGIMPDALAEAVGATIVTYLVSLLGKLRKTEPRATQMLVGVVFISLVVLATLMGNSGMPKPLCS